MLQAMKVHAAKFGLSNGLSNRDWDRMMQDKQLRDWKVFYPLLQTLSKLYCPVENVEMNEEMQAELLVSFKSLIAQRMTEGMENEEAEEDELFKLSIEDFSKWFMETAKGLSV